MMWWTALLAACTHPPDGPSTDVGVDRVDTLDDAIEVWPEDERETQWGWSIASGCDLDHDGRLEWATSAPVQASRNPYGDRDAAVVRIFEGQEVVAERRPRHDRPDEFGAILDAGVDFDGDGFGDLVFTSLTTSANEPAEVVLARGVDSEADTAIRHWLEGDAQIVFHAALLLDSERPSLLVGWGLGGFISLLAPDDMVLGQDQVADASTALDLNIDLMGLFYGEFAAADGDGDGEDEWLFGLRCWPGYGASCGQPVGPFLCETDSDAVVPDDCVAMGDPGSTEVGDHSAAGDLDGDGRDELVSAASPGNGDDGLVIVYRSDGTPLARIEGTHGAMFGLNPTVVRDGHGDPWLLVGQVNYSGNDPGTVWAFRGEQLVGNLIDEDATKVFQKGSGPLGQSIADYQETPDSPRWLLLGSGFGPVYMVPFDDP